MADALRARDESRLGRRVRGTQYAANGFVQPRYWTFRLHDVCVLLCRRTPSLHRASGLQDDLMALLGRKPWLISGDPTHWQGPGQLRSLPLAGRSPKRASLLCRRTRLCVSTGASCMLACRDTLTRHNPCMFWTSAAVACVVSGPFSASVSGPVPASAASAPCLTCQGMRCDQQVRKKFQRLAVCNCLDCSSRQGK